MTPNRLSAELKKIAGKIEASKRPDRNLVASDLKYLMEKLASGTYTYKCDKDGTEFMMTDKDLANEIYCPKCKTKVTKKPKAETSQKLVKDAKEDE